MIGFNTKRMSWISAGVAVGIVSTACAESPRPASPLRVQVDTISGVEHVRTSGSALAWELEPVLRLGAVAGGPEEFGRIRSVVADAAGRVYVADNLAQEIRVFSREGRHERTIGRPGSGPGEFNDLYSLAWLGDELVAMDPGNARFAVFSPDGERRDMIRYAPITGPASLIRLHPLGRDGFYAPVVDMERPGLPLVRFTTTGPSDTIAAPRPPPAARAAGVLCHRPDGGITGISLPDAPRIVYGFPPPGGTVAVSWTDTYRIAFLDSAGDTARVVVRDTPRPPYPDELWEEGMRPYRELQENFPGSECEPSAPERPRFRAALRHLMFDDAGRMWVEAAVDTGFVWEVFDAQGRLLGAVQAPARVAEIPPYVRSGVLYQVESDEMDVQRVAVYRVSEALP